jgi:hypothetical protein
VALADDLLATYQAEVATLQEELQEVFNAARQEFRETRDPSIWMDLGEAMEPFRERKERLNQAFLDDVRLVLTPAQDENWDDAMRMRRRMRTMNDGLLSGESVDLVATVQGLDLPEDTEETVRPVLRQYEIELDRALVERNKKYEEGQAEGMRLWREQNFEEIERLFDDARDAAVAVRDINRRFARQIGSMLEGESADAFQREFRERSFPTVYRETYAKRAMNTVEQFEDLTPDQQTEMEQIRASFAREFAALASKQETAIEEREMTRTARDMFGWGRRGGGGGGGEMGELREERRELEERTVERIRRVLNEDQASRLPERPSRDWRRRDA